MSAASGGGGPEGCRSASTVSMSVAWHAALGLSMKIGVVVAAFRNGVTLKDALTTGPKPLIGMLASGTGQMCLKPRVEVLPVVVMIVID
eukprot:8926552-Karenia_brevis.AAC.1